MLRRMVSRKQIKLYEMKFDADWFLLNATPKRKKSQYEHEIAGGDLFAAYHPFMDAWSYEPPILSDRADRGMRIFDLTVYFEVDCCNEGLEKLEEKVDNYITHSARTGERFHVVFAFVGDQKEIERRGLKLLLSLQERKRGNQFLVASHSALISNPLGEVLLSPKGQALSLKTLNEDVI